MLKTYLDTTDSVWLDESGNFWRDGFPQLIAGGHEKIKIILVKSSPNHATEAANPDSWERDTSWAADGNSAMLTVDTDYKHLVKLSFSAIPNAGDTSLSFSASGLSTSEFSAFGEIYLYRADNSFDALGYSGFSVNGDVITFTLSDSVSAGEYTSAAIPQMPLASAFLAADESDIANGEWVFNLVVDSARLREMTEYSSTASVSIPGVELLFFRHLADSTVQKIRAYMWDSISLRNPQGNPGFAAELPDVYKDQINASVIKAVQTIGGDNEYTAMEVYAHDFDITAGTVDDVTGLTYNYDVPASLTHRMRIRTGGSDNTKSDVIVDWGDGQVSSIAGGEYLSADGASSQDYVMEHTYAATGRYIIKIYGKDYYSVCTPPSNMEPTKYYLLSRILEADLPVASNFTNFSSLCRYAYRLQKIAASDYHKSFAAVRNIANMCDTCVNLVSVTGLANQFLIVNAASNVFKNCYSLSTLDFTLPAVVTSGEMTNALQNCVALNITVQSLIPAGGFIGRLNIHDLFNNMRLLRGTLPAELLWNSDQVTWTDTTQVFWGAVPDDVRAQAPVSWGGTASDDIINSGSSSMQTVTSAKTAPQLAPAGNTRYLFTQALTSLTILAMPPDSEQCAIEFTTGNTFAIDLPDDVKFFGAMPVFNVNTTYLLTIGFGWVGVGIAAEG